MSTNYRNCLGNHLDFDEWKTHLGDKLENCSKSKVITKNGYEILIAKNYIGTSGSLFKVIVDCSEDLEDFFGYHEGFQGEISAQADYDRVIAAINSDTPIVEDGINL